MGNSFTTTPAAAPATTTLPTYVPTLVEARDIATGLMPADVAAFLAASEVQQIAALAAATSDIDVAMKYQGRKYGPAVGGVEQVLEFPRYTGSRQFPMATVDPSWWGTAPPYGRDIWDWDASNNTAVVPEAVKRACVLQASSRLSRKRDARLDAQHDGVASQGGGGLQEAYTGRQTGMSVPPLCRVAHQIMERYRLRSGELV